MSIRTNIRRAESPVINSRDRRSVVYHLVLKFVGVLTAIPYGCHINSVFVVGDIINIFHSLQSTRKNEDGYHTRGCRFLACSMVKNKPFCASSTDRRNSFFNSLSDMRHGGGQSATSFIGVVSGMMYGLFIMNDNDFFNSAN